MAVRIVQLGSPRASNEGLRIGTVRRPPRGVPKSEFASRNYYDVWLPNLAPSEQLLKAGRSSKGETDWRSFVKRYRSEMNRAENSRVLDLLAALSHQANFSVGCYCNDEQHCHRSVLRQLLVERGAALPRTGLFFILRLEIAFIPSLKTEVFGLYGVNNRRTSLISGRLCVGNQCSEINWGRVKFKVLFDSPK